MFVNIKKLAVASTMVVLAIIPITASADTVKSNQKQTVLIDAAITNSIFKKGQYASKDSKHLFGLKGHYDGPTEAFFINGIN